MSIIHAKSAKKLITRIIYKKDPKTKMGSLITAIKPKMTNKNCYPKHKIQMGKTFHKRRIKNTVDIL